MHRARLATSSLGEESLRTYLTQIILGKESLGMKHSHGLDSLEGRSEAESFHVNYKTKK